MGADAGHPARAPPDAEAAGDDAAERQQQVRDKELNRINIIGHDLPPRRVACARPQYAIAQSGSRCATHRNARSASNGQNPWRSATP